MVSSLAEFGPESATDASPPPTGENAVTPISVSPAINAVTVGLKPRKLGNSELWKITKRRSASFDSHCQPANSTRSTDLVLRKYTFAS